MQLPNDAIARVVQDFDSADLGDPRRHRRLGDVVAKLAAFPGATLPDAMGKEAALEGLYRMANSKHVSPTELFDAHAQATAERARAVRTVLVVHDTTTCSASHADPNEVGFLPTGGAGFLLHIGLVVDHDHWRRTLGVVSVETISRKRRSARGSRKRKVSGPETAQWTDRESLRWIRGVRQTAERLAGVPHINVADREGDSYQFLATMKTEGMRFVVRCNHDRRARDPAEAEDAWSTIRKLVGAAGILEREAELSARERSSMPGDAKAHPPREARLAKLRFSAMTAEIPSPNYIRDPLPKTLTLNVVHVEEIDAPTDADPVEWRLYTTEPIETAEQVANVVDIYRNRWVIEEFNKGLKTGCSYEKRQFESLHALLVMLAISLPIASELLWLRSRARTEPDAPASEVATPLQIEVLQTLGKRKLSSKPTVRELLLALAALGGHQRANGEPGWLVLHRGMRKLLDYELAWTAAMRRSERQDL